VSRIIRVATIAALATVLASAVSRAADMPKLPPTSPLPPPPATKWSYSGWYVRGDFGSRWGLVGDVNASGVPASDNQLGAGATAGAGIGIKSSFMRADITADYAFPVKYTGTLAVPDDTHAKIQSFNILANGYFDLGTWYSLTPYVGAGAGVAMLKVTDAPGANSDNSRWNFAWAGMAGLAWTVGPNLQMDFGYRYLNVGKAESGGATPITFDNVASHEVRVGLRWNLEDVPTYR
jgi:opacity protein-like surface antigen